MPLPNKFDENEIFITILGIILTLIFVKIVPNRFSYSTSLIIILFNISIGISIDHILAGPPLDLYDVMDNKNFELYDLIIYLFVYGPCTYIIIYIYDRWFCHKSKTKIFFYIVFIALLNTGFEFIAVYLKVYVYNGWKTYYSFPVYFIVYFTNIYLLKLLRINESKQEYFKG